MNDFGLVLPVTQFFMHQGMSSRSAAGLPVGAPIMEVATVCLIRAELNNPKPRI